MNMDAFATSENGAFITSQPLALFFIALGFICTALFISKMYSLYKRNKRMDPTLTMGSLHVMNVLTLPLVVINWLAIESIKVGFNFNDEQYLVFGVGFGLILVAIILIALSKVVELNRNT